MPSSACVAEGPWFLAYAGNIGAPRLWLASNSTCWCQAISRIPRAHRSARSLRSVTPGQKMCAMEVVSVTSLICGSCHTGNSVQVRHLETPRVFGASWDEAAPSCVHFCNQYELRGSRGADERHWSTVDPGPGASSKAVLPGCLNVDPAWTPRKGSRLSRARAGGVQIQTPISASRSMSSDFPASSVEVAEISGVTAAISLGMLRSDEPDGGGEQRH
ncbi:hypothetical protein VFPFJ_05025 [Purpureocillium lilacinum]|uniref:Uncharacterized protein n=1 Tax=Purpureocillium lilacinum TaxID=33203 RepID=A0A179HKE2_PURLI|nr:hypothetical protein VFPFJ_05025 [Purpureocillium lilacinum]OAQ90866.1 hypothetical protein VFPFJ_05025 [Purpureocillium lilacinum]